MDDPDALFEQWKNKQNAMGRRVPETFAPYYPPKKESSTKPPKPTAVQSEYQRLIAIIESRSTSLDEYKRAQQDLHNLVMRSWEIPETHQQGMLGVENLESIQHLNLMDCDFGLQISKDGRVWVCVNGIAFLRFKPKKTVPVKRYWPAGDLGDDCDGDLEGYDGPE